MSTTQRDALRPVNLRRFRRTAGLLATTALLVGSAVQGLADAESSTVPPATAGYGAAPIESLNYPAPADAYYVSPDGSDRASGSVSAPWQSVQKAVNAAPTGSTIVLRQGTYREYVTWYGKRLTLQPYPGERAVFDGSVPVDGWVADSSSLWHVNGWTTQFKQGGRPDLIGKKNAYAAHPDMVFVDGTPLRQVGSRSDVVEGTFYADYGNDRLYVGTDPAGHNMAASTLSRGMYVNSSNGTVVRGLTFQRYATHPDQIAAVLATGNALTFENNTFQDNAAIGLSVLADNSRIVRNTAAYNGQMGFHSHKTDNLLIQGNWMHHNNTELFYPGGAEGGLKVTTGTNQVWADNVSEDNFGDGLWCDIHSRYITIVRNVVRNNTSRGIKCEISADIIVASNLVTGNRTYGILNNESKGYQIWNNTLVGNGRGIQATDWTRQTNDPVFPESVGDTVIRNNVMVDASSADWGKARALLAIDDFTRQRSAAQMGVMADYNAYYRSGVTPKYVTMWARSGGTVQSLDIASFRLRTGQETHGISRDGAPAPFVDPASGNFSLQPGCSAVGAGAPLPARIADAIGVAAGVPVDMGILSVPAVGGS